MSGEPWKDALREFTASSRFQDGGAIVTDLTGRQFMSTKAASPFHTAFHMLWSVSASRGTQSLSIRSVFR